MRDVLEPILRPDDDFVVVWQPHMVMVMPVEATSDAYNDTV
jgi:hypothetical protein